MDKFGEKIALVVGQDMRANTIALRLKHPVMSLERLCTGREFSLRILVILYVPMTASDTTAPQQG